MVNKSGDLCLLGTFINHPESMCFYLAYLPSERKNKKMLNL